MNNYFSRKIYRLFESRNILKIKFFIHKIFKEKDIGSLNLDFTDKPSRVKVIKDIIQLKNYKLIGSGKWDRTTDLGLMSPAL